MSFLRNKLNIADGFLNKLKAKMVAKDFQRSSSTVDYIETVSLVV